MSVPFTDFGPTPFGLLQAMRQTDPVVGPIRVGKLLLPGALDPTVFDLSPAVVPFIYPVSEHMGLPPSETAGLLKALMRTLHRRKLYNSLWVPVLAQGSWYQFALEAELFGCDSHIYVTDGTFPQNIVLTGVRDAPSWQVDEGGLPRLCSYSVVAQHVLLALGRLRQASTSEIAAAVGRSERSVRDVLVILASEGVVTRTAPGATKYPSWQLTRQGLLHVRRAWGVPGKASFSGGREASAAGYRHRHLARLWPQWLRQAWGRYGVEVFAGWSEVRGLRYTFLTRKRPDALAYGLYGEREVLFWLEVESGHRSREVLSMRVWERVNLLQHNVYPVIFVVMGPPWVVEAIWHGSTPFWSVPSRHSNVAVVFVNWRSKQIQVRPTFGEVVIQM